MIGWTRVHICLGAYQYWGVGFVLSPRLRAAFVSVTVGARCLAISIADSPFPAVVLIAVYSPTAKPGNESEVLKFYKQLSAFVSSLDSNTPYVILGHFNATLAPTSAKGCRFPTTNDNPNLNTSHLNNFIRNHDLFTVFPTPLSRPGHLSRSSFSQCRPGLHLRSRVGSATAVLSGLLPLPEAIIVFCSATCPSGCGCNGLTNRPPAEPISGHSALMVHSINVDKRLSALLRAQSVTLPYSWILPVPKIFNP